MSDQTPPEGARPEGDGAVPPAVPQSSQDGQGDAHSEQHTAEQAAIGYPAPATPPPAAAAPPSDMSNTDVIQTVNPYAAPSQPQAAQPSAPAAATEGSPQSAAQTGEPQGGHATAPPAGGYDYSSQPAAPTGGYAAVGGAAAGAGGYGPPNPPAGGGYAPAQPADKKSGSGLGKVIATAAVVGVLAGGIGGAAGFALADNTTSLTSSGTSAGDTSIKVSPEDMSPRADNSISTIAKRMLPTVVSIVAEGGQQSGTGSGFIVRQDGYIVTNNHVVAPSLNGGKLSVVFNDKTTKEATLVGRSPEYDLAVVKVDASGLPVASIGDSSKVQVGDATVAVGSPLGLSGTVTSGIVSALNRPVTAGGEGETSFINAIQTDAAINPGNSGGPLVNAEAQVIGVNSAIASLGSSQSGSQSGSIGLGFAIPSNTAKRVTEEIIATGTSKTPIIGASLNFNSQSDQAGASVQQVTPGGPADKAGLKAGDVITAVNGQPIEDGTALITAIRSLSPGDTVTLTVKNGGQTRDIKVTLGTANQ